jgi:uncharacterized protein (DUF169 family)
MADLNQYHEYGEELEKKLRLKTFPLALRFLKKEEEIPEGTQRPLRDTGHHSSLCQSFQLSRREGAAIAMLKEDMWCPEPVIGYGLGEPPAYFMEGHNRFPKDVKTLEAGRNFAREFPRLKTGNYIGILSAPLKTARFGPDLVMIYCDSAQLSLLLLGREHRDGSNLPCALSSHAACVYGVVPAMQSKNCQVAVPCGGDRNRAMARDDEMIFTMPKEKIEDVMIGLRYVESTGSRLPKGYSFSPEYPLPESYQKIAKIMGYL